tara:strand:- start:1257 stop:2828 length:1572 start_codon:yes stop_codon:yes gene_type:complete
MSKIPGYGGNNSSNQGSAVTKKARAPKTAITKAISYSDTTNDLLLDISKDASASSQKSGDISMVKVSNTGSTPAVAIFGFQLWTNEDTIGSENFMHFLLSPGETISMPATRALITAGATPSDINGDKITSVAPNSNEYVDSTANVDSATADGIVNDASDTTVYLEPYTDAANCTANLFRVGDLIRVDNEIMEVTGIGAKAALATNTLTVKRGMYGSTAATGAADGEPVSLPFFNAYHDFDKYTVAQTDSLGRFKAMNFFGYGRATTTLCGITPGSVAIQFYTKGYQGLGLSDVTSNTPTGLTASTTYYLTIAADGGSALEINFTTDATNGNFGGENGLVQKIQNALDTAYYTAGNLFEKKVNVLIKGGDVIFESQSKLSTSAIALTAGTSGSGASVRFLAQANGRIPALANIASAVDARLEVDTVYDPVTYSSSYKNIFITDDGYGNLKYGGRNVGTINYETGAVDWQISSCPNAEFVVSALYNAPFSGKQDSTDAAKVNSLMEVLGNTPQQKGGATLKVETF